VRRQGNNRRRSIKRALVKRRTGKRANVGRAEGKKTKGRGEGKENRFKTSPYYETSCAEELLIDLHEVVTLERRGGGIPSEVDECWTAIHSGENGVFSLKGQVSNPVFLRYNRRRFFVPGRAGKWCNKS